MYLDKVLIVTRNLKLSLDTIKIERDNLNERVAALEAINMLDMNKVVTFEDKLTEMRIFLLISWALFVGFVAALMMK